MSSFDLSLFKIKLEPEFVIDKHGRQIPGMIYSPLTEVDYPDLPKYAGKMNRLIQKRALKGVIKESEVPWVVTYVMETPDFRFTYFDSNYGFHKYRIEARSDLCDICRYSIFAESDYETVYEYHEAEQMLTIHRPGRWQDIILKHSRNGEL